MIRSRLIPNERGMALVVTILIMAASAAVALSLGVQNIVENRIAANQKAAEIAFRNAETGLEHARIRLSSLFASNPVNVVKMRYTPPTPNWTFLFSTDASWAAFPVPSSDPDKDSRYDEARLNLDTTDYKVYVRDSKDLDVDNVVHDYPDNPPVIVRSVGFGPGGARQIIEVRLSAKGTGTQIGYYAQEGGGPTKANTNIHDKGNVSGGQVNTGIGTIH